MFVDSHCHLNYKGLVENQADILARARDSGVSAMLNISTREREWDDVIGLAEQEKDVWASVGIHPHEADQHVGMDCAKLVAKSAHPRQTLRQFLPQDLLHLRRKVTTDHGPLKLCQGRMIAQFCHHEGQRKHRPPHRIAV